MIKVLIVEDDPVAAQFIEYILDADPEVKVVGTAGTAGKALMMMDDLKPDVVTMDLDLPGGKDGYQAIQTIMQTNPVPIVVVTGVLNPEDTEGAARARQAGAKAILQKPRGLGSEHDGDMKKLLKTVKDVAKK